MDFMDMLDEAEPGRGNPKVGKLADKAKRDFDSSMDNDLNIAEALASIFDMVREVNTLADRDGLGKADAKKIKALMLGFDAVLGVLEAGKKSISSKVEKLIREREAARKGKDFKRSDEIRARLGEMGVILEDTPVGVKWKLRGR